MSEDGSFAHDRGDVGPRFPALVEATVAVDTIPDDKTKQILLALIQRCAHAENLLRRIGTARLSFSLDPGGPGSLLEGFSTIEVWIATHFEGHYYGDVTIEITESLR